MVPNIVTYFSLRLSWLDLEKKVFDLITLLCTIAKDISVTSSDPIIRYIANNFGN